LIVQKVAAALVLMQIDIYINALMWEVTEANCPSQDKYVHRLHL